MVGGAGLTRNPALDAPPNLNLSEPAAADGPLDGPQATEAYPLDVARVQQAPPRPQRTGASGAAKFASFALGGVVGTTLLVGTLFSLNLLGRVVHSAGVDIAIPPPPWSDASAVDGVAADDSAVPPSEAAVVATEVAAEDAAKVDGEDDAAPASDEGAAKDSEAAGEDEAAPEIAAQPAGDAPAAADDSDDETE